MFIIKNDKAFTLLELLLVITLMGILAGIALPRLHGTARGQRLEEGAGVFAEFVRQGRLEAVKRRLKVELSFSQDGREYSLKLQDAGSRMQEQFTTFGDSLLDTPHPLPEGIRFRRESMEIDIVGDQKPSIIFLPSGYGEAMELELVNQDGRKAVIVLGALYDEVSMRIEMSEPLQ